MKKRLIYAFVMIAIAVQLVGCSGNTPNGQDNNISSTVSDVNTTSELQSETVSTTSDVSDTSEYQTETSSVTSKVSDTSIPQSEVSSVMSVAAETSEPQTETSSEESTKTEETSTAEPPKEGIPQWTETAVSGERYVNTDNISSRVNAIQGSSAIKQYRLNDKVTVVAITDTNYYKLADGTFIHADYLSESEVTVQPPTSTTTSGGQEVTIGAEQLTFTELDDGTLAVSVDKDLYQCEVVVIPAEYNGKKVTQIADNGFLHLEELKSITIPEGITVIGEWAFNACFILETVNLPKSLKTIGRKAFCFCPKLQTVTASNGIEMIGDGAFDDTPFLKNQKGIRYLENWVIGCEEGMVAADIKDGTVGIAGRAFSGDDFNVFHKLKYIKIPDSVKYIVNTAFSDCTVEKIAIPESVTLLDKYLFSDAKISNLWIPTSVKRIDETALNCCRRLDNIYYSGSEAEWNELLKSSGWDGKIVHWDIRLEETTIKTPVYYEIHFNAEKLAIP